MQRVLSYLSFKGRSNRQRFWLTTLAIWGIIVVGAVLSMAMASVAPLVALLFLPVYLAAVVASLANAARRLHDRAKSAWWLLLFVGVPLLLTLPAQFIETSADPGAQAAGAALALLSLPFSIWAFVEMGCLKGTTGPNKYGDDPLMPPPEPAFA
ncbi:MAG: DUF805 domain-containing protein [Phenylobacterium sp.]